VGEEIARNQQKGGLVVPRKKTETVQDWPSCRTDRCYPLQATSICIEKSDTSRWFRVTLEHLDEAQAGHVHHVDLPLPIMPAGLSNSFFKACGFETTVGARIAYEDAAGKTVLAQFIPSSDGDWQVAAFEPMNKEPPNDG